MLSLRCEFPDPLGKFTLRRERIRKMLFEHYFNRKTAVKQIAFAAVF